MKTSGILEITSQIIVQTNNGNRQGKNNENYGKLWTFSDKHGFLEWNTLAYIYTQTVYIINFQSSHYFV
jgi:hypothetical protein